mmetsp:Transcript_68016/g.176397  ORF Transcript_68016/g.176397 Transcript_68016/m.176397 type:complete len:227 (-) Transcript_68016:216-896(-)
MLRVDLRDQMLHELGSGPRLGVFHAIHGVDELRDADRTTAVLVNHEEKLPQVFSIDVEDSKPMAELCNLSSTLLQFFKRELATSILVDTVKDLPKHCLLFDLLAIHVVCSGNYVFRPLLCETVNHHDNNQVQQTQPHCQECTSKDGCCPWEGLNHRHRHQAPTISCNDSLEESQHCREDRRESTGATRAILPNTLLRDFLCQWVDDLYCDDSPKAHCEHKEQKRPN